MKKLIKALLHITTQNSPIGGVAMFIELVEMDGVVRGIEMPCHVSRPVL
jgi:hypothetical protein